MEGTRGHLVSRSARSRLSRAADPLRPRTRDVDLRRILGVQHRLDAGGLLVHDAFDDRGKRPLPHDECLRPGRRLPPFPGPRPLAEPPSRGQEGALRPGTLGRGTVLPT